MLKINRLLCAVLIIIIVLDAFSGCKKNLEPPVFAEGTSLFDSFADIPGVTKKEIEDIEKLRAEYDFFIYGMPLSTESFLKDNGETGGYSDMLCQWLTNLFGIDFKLKLFLWTELYEKLKNGEIDFSGHIMPDEENLKVFYMTDCIAARQFVTVRLDNGTDLDKIAEERLLKYAFTKGSPTEPAVAGVTKPGSYEPVWIDDYENAYSVLKNGEADAFITTGAAEIHFIDCGGILIEDFFPLIFNPVSLATANKELESVVSVVNKALKNGAASYLSFLYNKGYDEYRQYKFTMSLNDEEKKYLQNKIPVPLAAIYFNYPIVFYDTRKNQWDGIAFSLLSEIEKITGLTFETVNDEQTEIYELEQMLREGSAHMLAYLIFSPEREGRYIWNKNKLTTDQYALLSKIDFPNVDINEIPFMRIALIKGTAYAEMFKVWFPEAAGIIEYKNPDEAFYALDKGEVDLVMAAVSNLLYFANFYEFSGYKANYLFNYYYEPAFTFNKEQKILCSVIDKAVAVIDSDLIAEQWLTKTYDYKVRIMSAQRPWLIGVLAMFFVALALLVVILIRNRGEGRRLEKLVAQRTREIKDADTRTEKLLKELDTLILITEIETDNIIFANEKIKKDFKLSENVIGEKCWEILYEKEGPTERCDFCPKYNPSIDTGETVIWERFIPTTNRYYRITSRYIDWPGGSRVYMQLYDDITEIKESINQIRETDEYTQLLLDATPLSCTLWNRDFKMVNCNLEALKLFEVKNKKDFFDHYMENAPEFQPDGEKSVEGGFNNIKQAFENEYSRFEWMHMLPGGELLPSEITLVRVKYKDDYLVAGYIRDLREYKRFIAEIDESMKNLHEANDYAQLLLDATPVGCCILDKDLKIINCNKETLTLFEIDQKEKFVKNFYDFSPELQPSGASSRELSAEYINKAFKEGYCRAEWTHQTYNGELLPCELIIVRVKYKDEYLVAAYFRDLRQQKASLEEINKSRIAAEAANRTKSIFLANMSHEIRTPMNSIIGFSELAQDGEIPAKTREYLINISENAKWLLNIINDILDISKIESGKLSLENIPFDLQDIFKRCKSAITPKAEEKGIELYCYAEPSISKKILGDPVRLRQAIMNLLSNAVKFTNSGTVRFFVTVLESDSENVTIQFEIKDSGIGMNPEQIKRIFEPFMQADESVTRRFGGTGLGLPITKDIIELMGGKLSVESVIGTGSKFSFTLNFKFIENTEPSSRENMPENIEKPNFEGEILICEDNSLNQQVLCDHLARVGIKSVVADNGAEGIGILSERIKKGGKMFDLIFMDIHMPVMDGLETSSKIIEMGIKTPIVAITANIMSDDLKIYRESGMSDCLSKPFTSQELWKCLMKYFTVLNYSSVNNDVQTAKDDELQKKLKINFVKNNQTKYDEIIRNMNESDIKSAHRIAHTLKSNAGQIGEKRLQEAAKAVEFMLAEGKNPPDETDEKKLNDLKTELSDLLVKLEPYLLENENGSENIKKITDIKKMREIIEKLEPMLQNNNSECLNLLGEIRAVPKSEKLAAQIENFNFKQAIAEAALLKKEWE